MNTLHRRQGRCLKIRRGQVAVEFALTAPLAFLIFFTAIEFGRMNMVRHSMENAAYEGARRGLVAGATESQIRAAATTVLDAVSVQRPKIRITNTTDQVTVRIDAKFDDQGWFAPIFFHNKTLSTTLSMTKDRNT